MGRIAVTGGSGFIGSHLVDALVDAGHTVHVLDTHPPHRDDLAFAAIDVTDVDGLTRAFEGVDVVFHLAAVSNINDAFTYPLETLAINVTGTANVWEAARRNSVGRCVLASTVWVYAGALGEGPFDEETPFHTPSSGHIYTTSKIAAEMVVHNFYDMHQQPFTILRYGIPYGPRMREELVIPAFINRAMRGEAITINGDGLQYRNYLYVADLCEAHLLAMGPAGENHVFNLEGLEAISIVHLAETVRDLVDVNTRIEHRPGRFGDYRGQHVSATKAADVLGWTATTPFEIGLRRVVDWYLDRRRVDDAAVVGD